MEEEEKNTAAPEAQGEQKPRRKRSGKSRAKAAKAVPPQENPDKAPIPNEEKPAVTASGTAGKSTPKRKRKSKATAKAAKDTPTEPGTDEPTEVPAAPSADAPVPTETGEGKPEAPCVSDTADGSPAEPSTDEPTKVPAAPSADAPDALPPDTPETAVPDTEPETPKSDTEPSEASADEPAAPSDVQSELPVRDEARISNISRTAQLSIERILAGADSDYAVPDESAPEPDYELPSESFGGVRNLLRGILSGVAKWFLLVLFFVLVIACAGVAWLYRSATPDMLPQLTVTFDGQEVSPTAYKWKVPVVSNIFKRTYAETLNVTTTALTAAIESASPDLEISDSEYETSFIVTDAEQETVFEGTANEFSSYRFTENGVYTGKLVVSSTGSSDEVEVTGSETWIFTFTVSLRPSVTLATRSAATGSVAAVRVGTTLSEEAPTLESELETVGFVKASSGWICYVPIPWNQAAGTVTLAVTADGYTEELTLTVTASTRDYKDYSSSSQRVSPYIGADDAPAKVKSLLTECEEDIAWAGTGFVQPFLTKITTPLTYGMSEYVGRSYSERKTNTGAGGRTSTNTVVKVSSGESFIAPGNGTVLLAEDLGGEYGLTLVIDHGAGLKSIFYGLQSLDVKKGEQVKQGQVIAVCNRYTVCEMRVGTVPVDPVRIWNSQCDGIKYY